MVALRSVGALNRKSLTSGDENGTIVVVEVVGVGVGGHCLSFLFLFDNYILLPTKASVNPLHISYTKMLALILSSTKISVVVSCENRDEQNSKHLYKSHVYLTRSITITGKSGSVQTRIETITEYNFHSPFLFFIL